MTINLYLDWNFKTIEVFWEKSPYILWEKFIIIFYIITYNRNYQSSLSDRFWGALLYVLFYRRFYSFVLFIVKG